jgi:ubiquitin carboxyl-terminal hydrolase 5/13
MASVLQTIFSLPSFETRFNENAKSHAEVCTVPLPADCVECQMHKVADGLLSGRYSHPAQFSSGTPITPIAASPLQHPSPTPVFQQGIKPTGFKALIGKGHEEFSTMKQQDSEEFFTHLITVLRRDMQKFKDRSDQGTCFFAFFVIWTFIPRFYLMFRSYNRLFLWHGTTTSMYRLQKSEVQGG